MEHKKYLVLYSQSKEKIKEKIFENERQTNKQKKSLNKNAIENFKRKTKNTQRFPDGNLLALIVLGD